jgi:hypothetical protein
MRSRHVLYLPEEKQRSKPALEGKRRDFRTEVIRIKHPEPPSIHGGHSPVGITAGRLRGSNGSSRAVGG